MLVSRLLLDYIAEEHGQPYLREFVRNLGAYTPDTWDTLVNDIFGLSPEEFETGWNGWLAERYKLDQAD